MYLYNLYINGVEIIMRYIVIENHRTEFPDPIALKKGEIVIIWGEKSLNWSKWTFCTKMDGSNKGWVPEQIIKLENNCGIITEDYSAKELNIDRGTIVELIKRLNGWIWVKNTITDEIGWIPECKAEEE